MKVYTLNGYMQLKILRTNWKSNLKYFNQVKVKHRSFMPTSLQMINVFDHASEVYSVCTVLKVSNIGNNIYFHLISTFRCTFLFATLITEI